MVRHRSQRSKEKRIARIKSKRGSARQVVADYIKELEKKGAGTSRAKRKITRLEGEERDEEGQERRQRRGQGRGKRGNVVVSCKY
ncbi:hypothetical protein RIR_jg21824.t1 [Rhizophagus irregularis DAOM 181602=DAOM 197198]|nr:hypothetical protein RIR_jg21824.t1 [Rhizophagus irregularis DAOM 181602=DAOM 197198]